MQFDTTCIGFHRKKNSVQFTKFYFSTANKQCFMIRNRHITIDTFEMKTIALVGTII